MKLWFGAVAAAVALASLPQVRADDLTEKQLAVGVGGRYYENSDNDNRYDQSLDAVLPLTDSTLTVAADSHWATAPAGNAASQELLVGLKDVHFHSYSLTGAVGLVRFDAGVTGAGLFEAQQDSDAGRLRFRAEYTPLFETAQMIRNEIMFAGIELYGKASLTPRVHPSLDVFLRSYSDNNDSLRVRGNLPFAVVLTPVRWELGYREEYAAFRRQTNHGYYDPGELNSFQGVSSMSYWTEKLEAYAEAFGGLQKSTRAGTTSVDAFAGFYAEAALRVIAAFEIALTAEADDYALATASGFRHVQIGVRLVRKI